MVQWKPLWASVCIVWLIFCSGVAESQQETPSAEGGQLALSLAECISLALESNVNIRIQRVGPHIQEALVMQAKGRFDPALTFGPNLDWAEQPSLTPFISGADVQTSNTQGASIGIDDPIFTGGSYGFTLNSTRSESNSTRQEINPAYRSILTLNLTQPLLEGFGGVNNASIAIARNNKAISVLELKAQLINTLSEVQSTYWELIFAHENLKAVQLALKQAQELLSANIRRREVGELTTSDVLQAQAAVASREADVIAAQDTIKDIEDGLKRLTNIIQDESAWEIPILPVDPLPVETVNFDLDESIAKALQNRPEYMQMRLDLENDDIIIKVAKNQRLPRLDLQSSLAFNGLGGQMDDALSDVGKFRYDSWRVGLFLRVPLGDRAAKGELKRSQLEKEQRLLGLQDLEQRIIAEVRETIRQIETDAKRIQATEAAEDFARQALDAEEKKNRVGLSTSHDLLQFQSDLETATRNRLRAVIDYRQSVVLVYRAVGMTLEALNIALE